MKIRQALASDAARLLAIYGPIVESTAVSFEFIAPTEDEFARRITTAIKSHEWLVMESMDALCGYAYATPHRAREGYKHSIETSVYVHTDYQGQKIGTKLYEALFSSPSLSEYHNAYAGITLPNEASIALHKSLGFQAIGIFREVGYKHGSWHDVAWLQRTINS